MFPVQEQELQIEGFSIVSNLENANTLSKRGILFYISNLLTFTVRNPIYEFHEQLFIDVTLNTSSLVSIGLYYRSPNSSSMNNDLLLKSISKFCDESGDNVVILGDFNLPRINWANNRATHGYLEESFIECIMENFLYQHIHEATRSRSGQNENILDLVLTKDDDYVNDLTLKSPLGKSDHLVIAIVLNEPTKQRCIWQRQRPRLHKGDYSSMKGKLLSWDWEKEFNDNSANTCWEIFKEKLLCLQKEHIPLAVATTDPKPSWMNKEVCTALSLKRGSWKRYSMCKTDSNLEAYKKARNKLKQVTMIAKKGLERRE